MGALKYNAKKLNHPDPKRRAELLDTNFSSFDLTAIKREVEIIRLLRPGLNKYVYHTSLNFSAEEAMELDNGKLLAIAHDYLQGMGFTNNQYMIFRHYDAEHPHIHLLVTRICFDGSVVSDSNNYKRSEALLRRLEAQYDLGAVYQSSYVARKDRDNKVSVYPVSNVADRAPKKDELEQIIRTGRPSAKMRLQEELSHILKQRDLSMQDFVQQCESVGIGLLFNQQLTGRISGITYFYRDFKAKGQALGSRFKWTEIIKLLDYEQIRDSETVSQASARTKEKYGEFQHRSGTGENEQRSRGTRTAAGNTDADAAERYGECQSNRGAERGTASNGETNNVVGTETQHALQDSYTDSRNTGYTDREVYGYMDIEIAEDIDDEAILGKNRRRQQKARTNQR